MPLNTPQILKDIIEEKKKGNHRISLRSLAMKIGIPSGRLSEILSGKRKLTEAQLEKICVAFKLEADDETRLRQALQRERNADGIKEKKGKKEVGYGELLVDEQIERLVNWKPYAIMTYLQTMAYQKFSTDDRIEHGALVARSLGLVASEVEELLMLMSDKRLISWSGVRWLPVYEEATTGYDVPSALIKNSHAQDLVLAQTKLQHVDVARRDFSSITLALDPRDMVKAKKMIRNFRRSFARTMEKGLKKEVFQISIQFFPLSESTD